MNGTKVLGVAAAGALLALTVPAERALAVSLINPGAAASVQADTTMTTEVHWHHHHWHRHWHRHWHHHRHW